MGGELSDRSRHRADNRNRPNEIQKRTCAKLIRFNSAELQLVAGRARAAGRPIACYIRESSLGPSPRARRMDLNDSLIRAFAKVATRLAPIAATAREEQLTGAVEFESSVSEVLAVIRDLD